MPDDNFENWEDIENIENLKKHRDEIERQKKQREENIKRLEGSLESLTAREELRKQASVGDDISNLARFRRYFCENYSEESLGILDIGEIVAKFAFAESVPVSVAALIAIKIAKMGIRNYCQS